MFSFAWRWLVGLLLAGPMLSAVETTILSPENQGGALVYEQGTRLTLTATSDLGPDAMVTYEWVLLEVNSGEEIDRFEGESVEYRFSRIGYYQLRCTASESYGGTDETPASRLIYIAADPGLGTQILSPSVDVLNTQTGAVEPFTARVLGTNVEDATIEWLVLEADSDRATIIFIGNSVNIPFSARGRYKIVCRAVDPSGFRDPTPASLVVDVRDTSISIDSPSASSNGILYVDLGATVTFQGSYYAVLDEVSTLRWRLFQQHEPLCEDSLTCSYTFATPGMGAIIFEALSSDGSVIGRDFLRYSVGADLYMDIVKPAVGMEIALGEELDLKATVGGTRAEQSQVGWVIEDTLYPGAETTFPGFSKVGTYTLAVYARDAENGKIVRRRTKVLVYDPNQEQGTPSITSPRTDLTIRSGDWVFCDSNSPNARADARAPYWEIVQLSNGRVRKTSVDPTLGRYQLNDVDSYLCNLYHRTSEGDVLVDSRRIDVLENNPDAFATNSTTAQAATITAGHFEGLVLDRAHYYKLEIPQDGLTLRLNTRIEGPAMVVVFAPGGGTLLEKTIERTRPVQITNVPKGTYTWGIIPTSTSVANKNLDFSFSLSVLTPGLWFPDLVEDGAFTSQITVINNGGDENAVEFIAYDNDGQILEKQAATLAANGSIRSAVSDLFPNCWTEIAWIRVDGVNDLLGYSEVNALNGLQSYGVNGARVLEPSLYVPHVAQDTTQFYTKATLINGQEEANLPVLDARNQELSMSNSDGYSKETLDFVDKFSGNLPQDLVWAIFADLDEGPSLAGTEVFGKNDEDQIVGLGLSGLPADNPNLTLVQNKLYFAHIARDTARFWTGFALVNVDGSDKGVIIRGYGDGGSLIGEKTITLTGNEKQVSLADTFLSGIGDPSNVDWVEVEADSGVVGYELFGTFDNKQMAGLETIVTENSQLCFPFADGLSSRWQGYAVVNTGDESTQVTFTLYGAAGTALQQATRTLASKEKSIFLLSTLFDDIPDNASWLKATADEPLIGFELFGTDETMVGITAQ